jgi:8-oxo-dGTP pyrophosphatase MutT (NUDIX family)
MATTALFAELLVIGLQAEAWLILAVLLFIDPATVPWASLDRWTALLTVALVAAAYSLGIIVDRFADRLMRLSKRPKSSPVSAGLMRLTVLKESEALAGFLDYLRSRVRVARGTTLNLIIGGCLLMAFLARRTDLSGTGLASVVGLLIVLVAVAAFASMSINGAYIRRLSQAYVLVRPPHENFERANWGAAEAQAAAAVCVQPCVLLVRTKGGQWTFPKGKPDRADSDMASTAARELDEEAGAVGFIESDPFTTFDYPKNGEKQRVAAFIVRDAKLVGKPEDDFRRPRWMTRTEAAKKLCRGRSESACAELVRVLDHAIARAGRHPAP